MCHYSTIICYSRKSLQTQRLKHSYSDREAKWDNRFHLDPMPQYDIKKDAHAKLFTESSIFKTSVKRREKKDNNSLSDIVPDSAFSADSSTRPRSRQQRPYLPSVTRSNQSNNIVPVDNGVLSHHHASSILSSPYVDQEQLFDKLVSRVRKLWQDLRIPKRERRDFAELYMFEPSKENITILTQEVRIYPSTERSTACSLLVVLFMSHECLCMHVRASQY